MTLTIRAQGKIWTATFSGTGAENIERLFGTRTLPTAYLTDCDGPTVVERLKAAHPTYDVRLEP